jgi:hypothetical protein
MTRYHFGISFYSSSGRNSNDLSPARIVAIRLSRDYDKEKIGFNDIELLLLRPIWMKGPFKPRRNK